MGSYKPKGIPWNNGIGHDVSNCITSKDVMIESGLDYSVEKCPLVAKMPFMSIDAKALGYNSDNLAFSYGGALYKECPNAFGTYRTDYGIPLGVVKSKYVVVQNIDAFNFFDDAIGNGNVKWDRAGYFGSGERIFVSAKVEFDFNVGNNKDRVETYLVFGNSHDGSGSVNILFTPVRVICTNMLQSAVRSADSYIKIRHTTSAAQRINIGAEVLATAMKHSQQINDIYNAIYTVKMTDEQVMNYISKIVLSDVEYGNVINFNPKFGVKRLFERDYHTMENTNISTRKVNTMVSMFDYYLDGIGQKEILGTAWGAYNAITGYYSNVANLEGHKRMDSLVYGNASNVGRNALNLAITQMTNVA